MVAGWRGWANLSRPGGVLLTVQELSNPRPRRALSAAGSVFPVYPGHGEPCCSSAPPPPLNSPILSLSLSLPLPPPSPPAAACGSAILILLCSTSDTGNSEIIKVVARCRWKLCVKYAGDVSVSSRRAEKRIKLSSRGTPAGIRRLPPSRRGAIGYCRCRSRRDLMSLRDSRRLSFGRAFLEISKVPE